MKRLIYCVFFLATGIVASAQWYNPDKVNARAQFVYSGAIDALRDGDFQTGKTLLRRAVQMDPKFVDAWLSMGGASGQLKQYDSAVIFYERAVALDSVYSREFYLPYSINLAGLGRFEEAKQKIEQFLQLPRLDSRSMEAARYRAATYNFALNHRQRKQSDTLQFRPLNMGEAVNSPKSEYYPSFTINDSIFVFTRRAEGFREDFYKSVRLNGVYQPAELLQGNLNDEPSKGGLVISQDGEMLVFAGNFSQGGFGDFDLYICYATPTGWSEPFNLGPNINTEFWESSPTISPDKQTIYFSSNRTGGFGGKDLYKVERLANGRWGKAENMGAQVNTPADELAPFIHADNMTLYFTSGGHPGYGGSDIYLMRRGPGGAWSLPENLGYPINTIEDDGSLSVSADGKTAFFASARADSRGGLDLYQFELPAYVRPQKTLWIRGKVMDAKTRKGLPAAVELTELKPGGQPLEKVITNESGDFLITLPLGTDYSFTVNRKGYLFYSSKFLMSNKEAGDTYQQEIYLEPISLQTSLELKDILFETNSYTLNPQSFIELDKLVNLLNDNPTLKVQINGHTDNTGNAAANITLSANRARAVVAYLVSKGIAAGRLSAKGFGAGKPVASNDTDEGKAKNRRTELEVIGL